MRAGTFVIFGMLVVVAVGCGSSTPNSQMFYAFAGTASGSLGNMNFSDAPFTLVVAADTRGLTASTNPCSVPGGVCHIISVPAISVQFSLTQQNIIADFTSSAQIFVNQTFPTVGIQRLGPPTNDILDIQDQAFSTYDLKTAIGSVASSSVVLGQFNCNFGCVETQMGTLTLNSVTNARFAAGSAPD